MNSNKKSIYPQVRFFFDGIEYKWSGYLGCQLVSMERRTVPAGTTRRLNFGVGKEGIDITVYSTARRGLWVRTTWSVNKGGTHDEYVQRIERLRAALRELV